MAVYCCSDLHGEYSVWKGVQSYLKDDDTLIYLGDALDRGEYGWTILMEMLEDKRVVFVLGNHEDLLLKSHTEKNTVLKKEYKKSWKDYNKNTLKDIKRYKYSKKEFSNILQTISELPLVVTYVNKNNQELILSHAGFTPNFNWETRTSAEQEFMLLWDRDHCYDKWPKGRKEIIIHGHTPIQLLLKDFKEGGYDNFPFTIGNSNSIIKYSEGHKICIDCCTVVTKQAALLNLDTWEEILIKG